jgi:hypothetical protein
MNRPVTTTPKKPSGYPWVLASVECHCRALPTSSASHAREQRSSGDSVRGREVRKHEINRR